MSTQNATNRKYSTSQSQSPHDDSNSGVGGQQSSFSRSSASSATSAFTFKKNVVSLAFQNVTVMLQAFYLEGGIPVLLMILFHLYSIVYPSLSIGFESNSFNYSSVGDLIIWIQAVLRSAGSDWYPYEALQGIAITLFCFELLTLIVLLVSYKSFLSGSRWWPKIKQVTRALMFVYTIFNFVFVYWLSTFMSCDYTKNSYVLTRYSNVACWSEFNGSLVGLSIAFILIQIPISVYGLIIILESGNLGKNLYQKPTFLQMESFQFIVMLSVFNQLYIFISNFLPPQGYVVRPALHIVMTLILIIYLFMEMPFLNVHANAVYCGILFAKMGGPISALLSLYVNSANSLDLGLSFLLGVGLGSTIVLFLIGFGVMELSEFILRKLAQSARDQMDEESQSKFIGDRYLRALFKSKVFDQEIDEELVKYATSKKNRMSASTLIMSAIYTSTFHDNPQFSINTLKYALRQASFIQKITINSKIKEIEVIHGHQMTTEFSNMLVQAQKVENRLLMFRKLFWQYFVSNEDDQNKINSIVHAMYKTFEEGKSIYDLLVVSNPENQVLSKKRLLFFDNFSFRKVTTTKNNQQTPSLNKESLNEDSRSSISSRPVQNPDVTKSQQQQQQILNDQAHEYTEKVYKEAINSKFSMKGTFLFLIYEVIALLVIAIGIIIGVISAMHGTELTTILHTCQFTNVPYSILREVRLAYFLRNDPATYDMNHFYERMTTMKHLTQDGKVERYSYLSGDSLKYYSGNNFPVMIPTITDTSFSYTLQNVSIASLISDIEVVINKLNSWNVNSFENLEENYEYLYLLLNHELTSKYLDNFCQAIVNQVVNQPYDEAVIVNSILLGLFVIVTIVIIVLRATLNIKEKIIALFSKIPKDIVGILNIELEKQTDKKCDNSSYTEIFTFKLKMLLLLCAIFAVSVTSLSVTFYEAYNLDFTSRSSTLKLGYMSSLLINLHKEQLILENKIINGTSSGLGSSNNAIEHSWIIFRYGNHQYPTTLDSISSDAKSILAGNSSCNSISNCTGLDSLLEKFVMDMDSVAFNKKLSNETLVEMSSTLLSAISDKIHLLGDDLVNPMLGVQTKLSLGVFSGAFILILILSGLHYAELKEYINECNHTRSMLNMIPVDIISQIEEIKQFVLHNKLEKVQEKGGLSKARAIIDAASDGVFILKRDTTLIDLVNESGLKMLGYAHGELSDVMSIFGEGQNSVTLKTVLDKFLVATESTGEHLELEAVRKNGSSLSVGVSVSVFHHENKNLITILTRDITFEKKHKLLLAEERKKSDNLLLNILPERIAQRLKAGETSISEKFDDCTCLFSDMVGFTKMSSGLTAYELVQLLNSIINGFDSYITPLGLEKIKTIGDAYFCVGGLNGQTDHPEKVITFAIHMLSVINNYNTKNNTKLNIRVGINTGPVIAGCIGQQKFAYDLWGETLIIANLMESKGVPGRIQVSRKTYERVYDIFEFEEIKGTEIKPSVLVNTYLLKEKHHDITNSSFGDGFDKMFAGLNMFSPKTYNFSKIIQDHSLIQLFKDFLTGSDKVNTINFYELCQEYVSSPITSLRYNMAENMVRDYLEETAPKRLQFKYMKNAFGPFQIKFKDCNDDNCPLDLFENFQTLCLRALREEFPAFLKSKNFNKFLEQKKRNPEQLRPYVKDEHDDEDEDDEKAFIKFCEKCGTEIINLENHRFNDWEFNNRKELLLDLNQWRIHFEGSGGKTYLSPEVAHNHLSSSRRHVQLKYVYDMNCKHKDLFNAWIDEKSLSARVEQLTSSKHVDSVQVDKYMHVVCHENFKMPFPHSKREFVHAYCCSYNPSEEIYLCISRSINNPRVPPSSKQIRGEIKTAFMVKKLSETTCRYYYSVIIDCMGMLSPEYYTKKIYKETQQDGFHVNLVKCVDEFAKENRPPSGPLVNSLNYYLEHHESNTSK